MLNTIQNALQPFDVHLAILFGSQVTGKTHPYSDVDIGIALGEKLSSRQKGNISAVVAKALGKEVDIVDLRKAEGELLCQIVLGGQFVIRKDTTLLAELAGKALAWKEDFRPLLLKALEEKMRRQLNG